MNRTHAMVGFAGALLSFALSAQPPATVAFVDVNVVPMDRERVLMHQTVLVRDGDIAAVGSRVDIPVDARRVEGGGNAWLIPGLADMHTHLASGEDAALYAAAGVTTVLQMGGDGRVEPIPALRALLAQAPLAPQVFFAFMLDGEQPMSGGWPIHSVDEARFAVRVAKDRQYDFVKVYNGLRAAEFDAIVDESRKAGLAVIGHSVRAVGLPGGLTRGEVMVAHAEEFYYTTFGNQPDASKLPAAVDETRRSGAYVTPNLSTIDAIARQWGRPNLREQFLNDPLVRYMSPYSWLIWASRRRNYNGGTGNPLDVQLTFLRQFVLELSKQGVPLLAGTDSPLIPGLVPGAGINDELRTLVESGLSNYQALAAATRTPGEFIGKFVPGAARFGVIDAGARADLVLLADNPLEKLEALRKPLGVMIAGQWHVSEEIAAVLEQNRRNIAAQMQDVISAAAP